MSIATALKCSYMLFVEVLGAPSEVQDGIVVPWICFFAIATVVSFVSLAMKAEVFLQQLRERRSSLADLDEEETACASKLNKHAKRLNKTRRRIRMLNRVAVDLGCRRGVAISLRWQVLVHDGRHRRMLAAWRAAE